MSTHFGANLWAHRQDTDAAKRNGAELSPRLRLASFLLRTAFIAVLLVALVRVSLPQSESLWTIYDQPADLLRLALGLAACGWIAVQLFTMPKDHHAHRTWLHLGLIAVPFVIICIVAIW